MVGRDKINSRSFSFFYFHTVSQCFFSQLARGNIHICFFFVFSWLTRTSLTFVNTTVLWQWEFTKSWKLISFFVFLFLSCCCVDGLRILYQKCTKNHRFLRAGSNRALQRYISTLALMKKFSFVSLVCCFSQNTGSWNYQKKLMQKSELVVKWSSFDF